MLTTHFIRLCDLFDSVKTVKNMNMKTTMIKGNPQYYYQLEEGISTIKGGISVLKELHYPEEITSHTEQIICKL